MTLWDEKTKPEGDVGELMIAHFLQETREDLVNLEHIDDVYVEEGLKRSDWDLRATYADGTILTYEVKHEPAGIKYGNAAVEVKQCGKPSGIDITKADIWVSIIGHTTYFIGVEELERIIRWNFNRFKYVKDNPNEDGKLADFWCVPEKDLKEFADVVSIYNSYCVRKGYLNA